MMTEANVTIRKATPDDAELLTELIAASYRTLDNGQYDAASLASAMPLMAKANPRLLRSGTYYVVEVDGVTAACGGWSFEKPGSTETKEGVAHIRHFATHPDYLRRGLARLLLDHCLTEAASRGATLMKSQATLPAEKFYASAGFRTVGSFDAEMGQGIMLPVLDMEKDLSA
jgi:GNAT superfamily N-acetyltransferase